MPRFYDGDWYLISHDPQLKRTTWQRDNGDGTSTQRTDYEVQPTIDQNTAQRNIAQSGWKGDYHHVASVPLNVFYDQLAEAARHHDDKYVSKWLNDRDNSAWRTKSGNV